MIYTCTDHKATEAISFGDAAEIFAGRAARRCYGPRGYSQALMCHSSGIDAPTATYEVFIGRDVADGHMQGHNIWLTIVQK